MIEVLEPQLGEVCITSFEGQVDDETGRYHGKGSLTLGSGATYVGTLAEGFMHGKGVFKWPHGVSYEGDFVRGEMSGSGTYLWPDQSVYEGEVKNGKRHGQGVFRNSANQTYEGGWREGLKHGKGKMSYNKARTVMYEGYWEDGRRSGYGSMQYASGNVYQGQWANDRKDGKGLMHWKDRMELYLGGWQGDAMHGYGEHFWEASDVTPLCHMGNAYRGGFRDGVRHGFGTFFYSDGSQYSGYWAENKKHDDAGVFKAMDGRISLGVYREDRVVKTIERSNSALDLREFSTYAHLSILDSLSNLASGFIDPATAMATEHSAGVLQKQLGEIERLALRYNAYFKSVYRHYRDTSNSDRLLHRLNKDAAAQASDDTSIDVLADIDAYLESKRRLTGRFLCMSFSQLCRFCRESHLIGQHLSIHDLRGCLFSMHEQQRAVAYALQSHSQDWNASSECTPSANGEVPLRRLESFVETSSPEDIPAEFGINERDFIELFFRCQIRRLRNMQRMSGAQTISTTIHAVLANELVPFSDRLASETLNAAPVYEAMYQQPVQSFLSKRLPELRTAWSKLSRGRGGARIADVVRSLLLLRGSVLVADADSKSVLSALIELSSLSEKTLVAYLQRMVSFECYTDFLCRACLSALWKVEPAVEPAADAAPNAPPVDDADRNDMIPGLQSSGEEARVGESVAAVDLGALLLERLERLLPLL